MLDHWWIVFLILLLFVDETFGRNWIYAQSTSVKPDPYQHNWSPANAYNDIYTGWAYPPKDYNKWQRTCVPVG